VEDRLYKVAITVILVRGDGDLEEDGKKQIWDILMVGQTGLASFQII
jgi:hypothetical protein